MKKIIAALATMLFAISFVFGATGCNGNKTQQPSEDNASITQQPQPAPDTDSDAEPDTGTETESKPQPTPGTKPSLGPRHKTASFHEFNEFKNYYETEFAELNSEKFYLLYPAMESVNGGFPSTFEFKGDETLYDDEPYINPMVIEYITVYSEELGTRSNVDEETGLPQASGKPPCSFEFEINLYPLPKDHMKEKNFVFEYHKYSGIFMWQYEIKIFENDALIAEFYYVQTVDVPKEWIENYITYNLI